jgi:hypothetical protein
MILLILTIIATIFLIMVELALITAPEKKNGEKAWYLICFTLILLSYCALTFYHLGRTSAFKQFGYRETSKTITTLERIPNGEQK